MDKLLNKTKGGGGGVDTRITPEFPCAQHTVIFLVMNTVFCSLFFFLKLGL